MAQQLEAFAQIPQRRCVSRGALKKGFDDLDFLMGFHVHIDVYKRQEQAKLVPTNIREGVTVLGVKGSMSGSEGMKPQAKSVTPTFEQLVVLPDKAYNCLSHVTVQAIPATYVDNPRRDLRHYPVPLSASREGSNDNATTNGMARRG